MNKEVLEKVMGVVTPYVRNKEALQGVVAETSFLKDLQVSSSRLVDIVLAMEDEFGIEISDEDADKIATIGSAVDLISRKVFT